MPREFGERFFGSMTDEDMRALLEGLCSFMAISSMSETLKDVLSETDVQELIAQLQPEEE